MQNSQGRRRQKRPRDRHKKVGLWLRGICMLGTTTYVRTLPFSRHRKVSAKTLWWHSRWYLRDFLCLHFGRESKTNSQICMAALFRSPTMYVQKVSENSASTNSSQKIIWELCFVIVIAFAATTSNVVSQARHFL